MSIMVPLMAIGGMLLWRRNRWGGMVAGIAGIQGSLHLIVLSVNSGVAAGDRRATVDRRFRVA